MPQYSALNSAQIIGSFYQRYETEFAGSWISEISTPIASDKLMETYKFLGGAPVPREWLGERAQGTLGRYSHTVTNKKYESTLHIDLDDLRRDLTGQLMVRVGDMAARYALHREALASTIILGGDTTTYPAYDTQNFFDTDHDESGTNQVNDISSTEVSAANVTTTTAPTATEMANVLSGSIGYMLGYTDDKGEPVNGQARSWIAMVGTANLFSALNQAVILNVFAAGADNPLRGLLASGMTIRAIYNPRLSADTTIVNLFRTDATGYKPFINQVEFEPQTSVLGAGSDYEFTHDAHQFGVKAIYAIGTGAWQGAAQITLS